GEGLCIGVGNDEVHTLQPRHDHVVDGIAAGAADAEHDDARLHFANLGDVGHFCLAISPASPEREDTDCYLRALRSAATNSAASCPGRRAACSWLSTKPPVEPALRVRPSSRAAVSLAAIAAAVARSSSTISRSARSRSRSKSAR